MTSKEFLTRTGKVLVVGAGAATIGYAAMVAYHRARYGSVKRPVNPTLIDHFIPDPEVSEDHRIAIGAPASLVMERARNIEVLSSPLIRSIFRMRELALGGEPDTTPRPQQLLPQMQSIGWVVLAETAGREIVLGAVTKPWEAAPVFRSVEALAFRGFDEPGYVKIAWTLRADPISESRTMFHTETRVSTTDAITRKRFRTYWSFVAPGVELIRLAMLRPLKHDAERAAAARAA